MARGYSSLSRSSRGRGRFPRLLVIGFITIAIILLILFRSPNFRSAFSGFEGSRDDAISDAMSVGAGAENIWSRIGKVWYATKRVEELEQELAEYKRWKTVALSQAERMERYEDLLNLERSWKSVGIAAQTVSETSGPFTRTRLVNVGSSKGIQIGDAAVNEYGLVGRVVTVGNRSSRILLLTDYSSRVPVIGENSRIRGIVSGRPKASSIIAHIDAPEALILGERVLTSGDDGVLPRGLIVGAINREGTDWVVDLAADEGTVDFVYLISHRDIVAPELEGVNAADTESAE